MSSRDNRQTEILRDWRNNDYIGTLQACTGFGKTRVALRALKARTNGKSAKVIVPTLYLQDQWNDRLKKWGQTDVDVMVINSAVKESHDTEFLILDEIHRYASPVFSQIFEKVKYKDLLGLTATLPHDDKYDLIRDHAPVFQRVRLHEALSNGWVAPFIVYNLPVEMSFVEEREYKRINEKYHKYFSYFSRNFGLVMKCLNNNNFCRRYARQHNWDYNETKGRAANFMRTVNKRKKFLYGLTSKIKKARDIINLVDDKNVLVFTQSQSTADTVAEYAKGRAKSYHSGMKGTERNKVMQSFRDPNSGINVLTTAKALDEGANLPDVSVAIIMSGSSKPLQAVQRMGRTIRAKEGKRAIIVELYVPNTQDEKWLRNRQRKTPNSAIHRIHNIDDIIIKAE